MAGNARQRMRGGMDDVLQAKRDVLSLYGGDEEEYRRREGPYMGERGRKDYGSVERWKGWVGEREEMEAEGFFPKGREEKAAFDRVMSLYEGGPESDYTSLRGYGNPETQEWYKGNRAKPYKQSPDYWRKKEQQIKESWAAGRIGDHDYRRADTDYQNPNRRPYGTRDQADPWHHDYRKPSGPSGGGYWGTPVNKPWGMGAGGGSSIPTDPSIREFDFREKTEYRSPSYWKESSDYGLDQSLPFELRGSFPQDAPMPLSDAPYSSEPKPLKDVDDWAGSATGRNYERGY